jgi:antitoxin (DNA-binding transcriptional repressor) of toxin-antitoxin stability system
METLTVEEAQGRLPELIQRAHEGDVRVIIAREDGIAVRLEPVLPHGQPRFGSARGLFAIADDFDAPMADFAPYER